MSSHVINADAAHGHDHGHEEHHDSGQMTTAKASGGGGQVLKGVTPSEGAEAILKLLVEEGVLR